MLRWALKHAEEHAAARKLEDEGGPEVPEHLLPPDTLDGFGGWYEDFFTLSTERQIGMAEGEIPASVIARHVAGWPYDDAEMFEHCMRAMDRVWLKRGEKDDEGEKPEISARDAFKAATADGRRG